MKNIAIFYKNFATIASHTGLGIAAKNNALVLNDAGIQTTTYAINTQNDIDTILTPLAASTPVTHAIISALWVDIAFLKYLTSKFPECQFYTVSHSNLSFLSADPNGTKLLRQGIELTKQVSNYHIAGNSRFFCDWVMETFHVHCSWLPNMYFIDESLFPQQPNSIEDTINIGVFGATRAQKNILGNIGVAMEIATLTKKNVNVFINSGREEGNMGIIRAAQALTNNRVGLQPVKWTDWESFKAVVKTMDLCISLTYTESFGMVVADAVTNGVPTVCSNMVPWVPEEWRILNTDDLHKASLLGRRMLENPELTIKGYNSLVEWNRTGFKEWKKQLKIEIKEPFILQTAMSRKH